MLLDNKPNLFVCKCRLGEILSYRLAQSLAAEGTPKPSEAAGVCLLDTERRTTKSATVLNHETTSIPLQPSSTRCLRPQEHSGVPLAADKAAGRYPLSTTVHLTSLDQSRIPNPDLLSRATMGLLLSVPVGRNNPNAMRYLLLDYQTLS